MTQQVLIHAVVTPGIVFEYAHCLTLSFDTALTLAVFTSFRPDPLLLRAAAMPGDRVLVRCLPYRVELYVNDLLADEEWPAGEYHPASAALAHGTATRECLPFEEPSLPSVIRTFQLEPDWRPGGGVLVGDCMPYSDGERYHVIWLKDRHRHASKHGLGAHQWYHISTDDFRTFQEHPPVVLIDDAREGSICTGSHAVHEGVHYLYYTVRTIDGSPAPMRRSLSRDGYHYEKDRDFSFRLSARYTGASARDPRIVKDACGTFHTFITTSLAAEKKGCLAHLVSPDLTHWRELEPIYISETADEPECSDYFAAKGWYYLIVSLRGAAYYLVSRSPFADFTAPVMTPIPCGRVPKADEWRGRIIFTGFSSPDGGYGGGMIFREAVPQEDGRLEFI